MFSGEVITVIGTVLSALIMGWFAVAQAKKKTTVDVQASLNEGFKGLTDMLKDAVAAQKHEIAQLVSVNRALQQRLDSLTAFIAKHGLEIPDEKVAPTADPPP